MSIHTDRIVHWFDIHHAEDQTKPAPPPPLDFPPHQITFITGPSGAGKSSLLRHLVRRAKRRKHDLLDLQQLQMSNRAVIDLMAQAHGGNTTDEQTTLTALESLSRAGLGEVWTYLRTPSQLSEGQRWRLRLAIALETLTPGNCGVGNADCGLQMPPQSAIRNPKSAIPPQSAILIADEFTSLLDRITAQILSRSLRKSVTARPIHAILATSHEDIAPALQPDRIIRCDFGQITVEHSPFSQCPNRTR